MITGFNIMDIIGSWGSESMVDAPIQAPVARSPYIDRVLPMAEARRLAQGCNDALRSGPFEGVGTQKSQVRIYFISLSEFGKNKKGYLVGSTVVPLIYDVPCGLNFDPWRNRCRYWNEWQEDRSGHVDVFDDFSGFYRGVAAFFYVALSQAMPVNYEGGDGPTSPLSGM